MYVERLVMAHKVSFCLFQDLWLENTFASWTTCQATWTKGISPLLVNRIDSIDFNE